MVRLLIWEVKQFCQYIMLKFSCEADATIIWCPSLKQKYFYTRLFVPGATNGLYITKCLCMEFLMIFAIYSTNCSVTEHYICTHVIVTLEY